MTEQTRCTNCILSSAFPRIEFDANGVCNFCLNKAQYITEEHSIESARKDISALFESIKGTSPYDAVMCYSGGKDSTYTLMAAVKDYGLKVLSYTLDNSYISKAAQDNIDNVTSKLGVDHFAWKPSSQFFRDLVKASALYKIYPPSTLTRISAVCQSCITLVSISALRLCLEKDIPIVLAGFTIGQIPVNSIYYRLNYHFLMESREPSLRKLREHIGPRIDDYFLIRESLLARVRAFPYQVNLLCLENPTEAEILDRINKVGWIAPQDVDGCSSNCRLNMFNNYIHLKNQGYNPYELELSHLIRKKKLTREQALEKIRAQGDMGVIREIYNDIGISDVEV
jgi:hypothetical protein